MDQIWNRIETWLEQNAPEVRKSLNAGATDEQIKDAEDTLGATLPDDMRASYRLHNGQAPDGLDFIGSGEFLSLERIKDEWGVWNDLLEGGDFEDINSEPDKGIKNDWWNAKWIPITYDGGGNHDCLDLDPAPGGHVGQIIKMWHDEESRQLVATSFTEWLRQYADDLEAGEYVLSEEYNGLVSKDDL